MEGFNLKSYVAYAYAGGMRRAFVTHCRPFDTEQTINELTEYLKNNCCDGKNVIILNIIPLVGEMEEEHRIRGGE